MPKFDGAAFGADLIDQFTGLLRRTLGPIREQIVALDERFKSAPAPLTEAEILGFVTNGLKSGVIIVPGALTVKDLDQLKAAWSENTKPQQIVAFPSAEEIKAMIDTAVAEAVAALPKAKDGDPGKDVPLELVCDMVKAAVSEAVAELPPAKDGTSVTLADVAPVVEEAVGKAVAALPPAEPGTNGKDADPESMAAQIKAAVESTLATWERPKDGESVTLEQLAPMVADSVTEVVKAIPVPKDGLGIAGAILDRKGNLIITMTDGTPRDLGKIVPDEIDMNDLSKQVEAIIEEKVAAIPKPKDGLDGIGFDDIEGDIEGDRTLVIRARKGDVVKELVRHDLPIMVYREVWKAGEYKRGDVVTWGGSCFVAIRDTTGEPEKSADWKLSVKRGQNGKDGELRPKPDRGPVKV